MAAALLCTLAAEDRCHLNGLALDEGRPRYVTVVVLPGVTRPSLLGFKSDDIQKTIAVGELGTL
jgi:hypothetical protein